MTYVARKDEKEALENVIRRFNKKVQLAGVLAAVRKKQYFEKPLTKTQLRESAIRKKQRKDIKMRKIYLGR